MRTENIAIEVACGLGLLWIPPQCNLSTQGPLMVDFLLSLNYSFIAPIDALVFLSSLGQSIITLPSPSPNHTARHWQ